MNIQYIQRIDCRQYGIFKIKKRMLAMLYQSYGISEQISVFVKEKKILFLCAVNASQISTTEEDGGAAIPTGNGDVIHHAPPLQVVDVVLLKCYQLNKKMFF